NGKCTEESIKWYSKINLNQNRDSINYIKNKLFERIENIYSHCLLSSKDVIDTNKLAEFDEYIKKTNYTLYKETNNLVNDGKYHFKFIKYWRKHQDTKSIYFVLYRIYKKIILVRNKIFHKI
ncbi:MAG: hypothetical protein J6Y01_03590, partial [Spirochaetales bacterium]|nr:hypothetical protein [Spirochaetales bacterium]